MLVRSLPMKRKKKKRKRKEKRRKEKQKKKEKKVGGGEGREEKLANNVIDNSTKQVYLVHDVTYAECQT